MQNVLSSVTLSSLLVILISVSYLTLRHNELFMASGMKYVLWLCESVGPTVMGSRASHTLRHQVLYHLGLAGIWVRRKMRIFNYYFPQTEPFNIMALGQAELWLCNLFITNILEQAKSFNFYNDVCLIITVKSTRWHTSREHNRLLILKKSLPVLSFYTVKLHFGSSKKIWWNVLRGKLDSVL